MGALENRKVTTLGGQHREEYLEREVEALRTQYTELKSLIGDLILDDVTRVREENKSLLADKNRLEGQIVGLTEKYKSSIQRSRETMVGQKKASEDSLNWEIRQLKIAQRNIEKEKNELADKVNQLNEELIVKGGVITEQQIKLESREKEISMLEDVVEKVTGVKCDTEDIISILGGIQDGLSDISFEVDYDKLVGRLSAEGNLVVLSREEAKSLVDIVIRNKNYLIKSTTGKTIVYDRKDVIEKINIALEYIDNGYKTNKDMATKYGLNSTAALASKVATIKNGYFQLIVDYKTGGLTDTLINKYSEQYSEIIDILKEEFI